MGDIYPLYPPDYAPDSTDRDYETTAQRRWLLELKCAVVTLLLASSTTCTNLRYLWASFAYKVNATVYK